MGTHKHGMGLLAHITRSIHPWYIIQALKPRFILSRCLEACEPGPIRLGIHSRWSVEKGRDSLFLRDCWLVKRCPPHLSLPVWRGANVGSGNQPLERGALRGALGGKYGCCSRHCADAIGALLNQTHICGLGQRICIPVPAVLNVDVVKGCEWVSGTCISLCRWKSRWWRKNKRSWKLPHLM